ncbi:MAG: TIGR03960 family B12-binding radical SAM protein [Nitrospira sp.]|nr:TIGR03960 family B12-binding radical SAM protein [Nitrospira sp.]
MNLSSFLKPSRYINSEINSIHKKAAVRVALAFPDVYEVGMSHLGLKILYKIINDIPYASAERVFSPWLDLEAEMKTKGIPLSSLESNRPLRDFDIVGFSLQYELLYTTVLNMLFLGGIPLRTEERNNVLNTHCYPLVIAGGPCTVNPAPMSPFIDAFLIGDGEEAIRDILDSFYQWKTGGDGKRESLLLVLSEIEGMYVPHVHCNPPTPPLEKGGKGGLEKRGQGRIRRRLIKSLDDAPYPVNPIIPYTPLIHDRVNIEVSRGCSRGCRFCQAGITYRPVRERSPEKVLAIAENSLKNTGYEEVSLTSLSAGDYSCLLQVIKELNKRFSKNKIALSLPSLRVASINHDLLKEIRAVRKTGFTIAPEAGSERLRRVINKDFSEDDYERILKTLFNEGWHNIKLYFMIGLPTETEEDIERIPEMVIKVLKTAKQYTDRFVNINIGISPFIPKPHTPFQWHGQNPTARLKSKIDYLKDVLAKRGFKVKSHDVKMSLLEAAFSRGDEALSFLIEKAWSLGCRLDGWSDVFEFEKWEKAMNLTGINAADIVEKTYESSDTLPWENIDVGVTKEFLWKEHQKALSGDITPDCRKTCHLCGLECKEDAMKLRSLEIGKIGSTKGENTSELLNLGTSQPLNIRHFKSLKIRVEFSKTGRLKYLSHLELMTTLLRALRRAEFPLEYSKGFHPHPEVSFGPPLGVGIGGLSEYFDMKIIPPFDIVINMRKLNSALPEGIYIKDIVVIAENTKSLSNFITRYEYEIKGRNLSHIHKFLSEEEIMVSREKHKVNLRDMVEEAKMIRENMINVIVADQGDIKVRLNELLPKVFNVPIEELDITRVALYGRDNEWVTPTERSLQWTAKS